MFWHRGCPVAAVMSADAAVQVKVDFIRGPSARKVPHAEYALLRLRSGNGIVQTPADLIPMECTIIWYPQSHPCVVWVCENYKRNVSVFFVNIPVHTEYVSKQTF